VPAAAVRYDTAAMTVRVRIAPSPTGNPHVGTAYIALMNRCFARQQGGAFVLRIEDTDRERCTPESEAAIFAGLRWLGLDWDEGPDVGGPHGPYRQSERLAAGAYAPHLARLLEQGDAYRCFCTAERLAAVRAAQEAAKQPIMYDRCCRDLDPAVAARRAAAGEPHVVRMKAPLTGECTVIDRLRPSPVVKPWAEIDDQVLLKSDGWPTYHFAAVVDDHLMGITHVIRAEEWLNSTPKHLWLYARLGWTPPVFAHVGLLRNADRSKISKRKNPTDILWYRRRGYLPAALLNFLATLGHGHPDGREVFDLAEFTRVFTLDRLSAGGPVFDLVRLDHLQAEHFRVLDPSAMRAAIHAAIDERLDDLLPLLVPRMTFGGDVAWLADYLFAPAVTPAVADLVPRRWEPARARGLLEDLLRRLRQALKAGDLPWTPAGLTAFLDDAAAANEVARKDLLMIVRVAIAGRPASLPLYESLATLGAVDVVKRLEAARQILAVSPKPPPAP
jgi:glutamyl-tRNA synthetase